MATTIEYRKTFHKTREMNADEISNYNAACRTIDKLNVDPDVENLNGNVGGVRGINLRRSVGVSTRLRSALLMSIAYNTQNFNNDDVTKWAKRDIFYSAIESSIIYYHNNQQDDNNRQHWIVDWADKILIPSVISYFSAMMMNQYDRETLIEWGIPIESFNMILLFQIFMIQDSLSQMFEDFTFNLLNLPYVIYVVYLFICDRVREVARWYGDRTEEAVRDGLLENAFMIP